MRSVRTQMTLTFIIASVLVVSALGVLLSYEIERYYFERLLASLRTQTTVIAALLRESGLRGESRKNTRKDLDVFASAGQMRITLIDSSGAVAYDSDVPDSLLQTLENHANRPEVIDARKSGTGSNERSSKSVHRDLVYVARNVAIPGVSAGLFPRLQIVRISVDLTEVNRVMYEIRFKIALASFLVLVMVIVVSQLVSRRLTKPLTEIADIVKEIKAGNLDQKLPVRTNDEIGRLAELVNEMTDKLKSDIDQLKRLERVRSEFLGNVSHELRTPIFSLKGFLETLLDGAIDDAAVNRTFLEKAYHHANRLDHLLSDLIEISRIESGEMKMSFRYFDIVSFLHQAVQDSADQCEAKNQQLVVNGPDGDVMALGDKDRLKLAVGNIIDNASKYSPAGSVITVDLFVHEQSVTISVSDNGPGIDREHLPRVFERFYRVDKNRSREVGGTGLGLAIVKHIIEAHSSKISVASQVGKGTSFSFDLKK